jgi:hypothetical protein
MNDESREDLEGSGPNLVEIASRHLPGGIVKDYETPPYIHYEKYVQVSLFFKRKYWRVKIFRQRQKNKSHLYHLFSDSTFCWHSCTQPANHKILCVVHQEILII